MRSACTAGRAATGRHGARPVPAQRTARAEVETRAQSLGGKRLENVLDPAAPRARRGAREGQLQLKFQKQGNAFRDLNRSYREMCDRVSSKIWDDPNGKRVRFDVAGKPGLASRSRRPQKR
jgi:hypothetical protein